MACETITAGRVKQCKNFQGGLDTLYIFEWAKDNFTVSTALAVTAILDPFKDVYEFVIEGDANIFSQNKVSDRNTGATVNTETLTFSLKGIDATTTAILNKLSEGYYSAVVKDRNGIYHVVGLDDGIDFTITELTGGAKTDKNGYDIVGTATNKNLAPTIAGATLTSFLTNVVVPV